MKRNFDLTIELCSDDTFDVEIRDLESGLSKKISCHDAGENMGAENEAITNEIRSWVDLMRDEVIAEGGAA